MKRGRDGKKRKSMIQNPTLEHFITLEQGLCDSMATCGLHCCKIKVFYRGRLGEPVATCLPIVIDVIDARDYCEAIYSERGFSMESYIQEEFGSGIFEAALYDENNAELGRYKYFIGGAPEYIHYSKASDDEDSELKDPVAKLFMMLLRERFLEEDDYFLEEDDY